MRDSARKGRHPKTLPKISRRLTLAIRGTPGSYADLARKYRVSIRTVGRIKTRKGRYVDHLVKGMLSARDARQFPTPYGEK